MPFDMILPYISDMVALMQFNTKGTCVVPEDAILLLTVPIFRPSFLVDADVSCTDDETNLILKLIGLR